MEEEFIETFDAFGDAIFRFCYVKTGSKELAEDLTQETFMRYWRSLRTDGESRKMGNTRSFLYTIARNLVIDWYRKKKSESLDVHMERGFDPKETDTRGTSLQAEYQEVLAAMEQLEDGDREVLLLRYVEGLDPKDIADLLGEGANTISVRIHRATKRLQKKIGV